MAGKTGTAQVRRISTAERAGGVISNEDLPWKELTTPSLLGMALLKSRDMLVPSSLNTAEAARTQRRPSFATYWRLVKSATRQRDNLLYALARCVFLTIPLGSVRQLSIKALAISG